MKTKTRDIVITKEVFKQALIGLILGLVVWSMSHDIVANANIPLFHRSDDSVILFFGDLKRLQPSVKNIEYSPDGEGIVLYLAGHCNVLLKLTRVPEVPNTLLLAKIPFCSREATSDERLTAGARLYVPVADARMDVTVAGAQKILSISLVTRDGKTHEFSIRTTEQEG